MTNEVENNDLLNYPNYLLSTYQLEIYRQLGLYMEEHNLKSKDIAAKLAVSNSYVSQIMRGNFNFTLKKLIELGLAIDKVPYLEFISKMEYWRREKEGTIEFVVQMNTFTFHVEISGEDYPSNPLNKIVNQSFIDYKGGRLPKSVSKTQGFVK